MRCSAARHGLGAPGHWRAAPPLHRWAALPVGGRFSRPFGGGGKKIAKKTKKNRKKRENLLTLKRGRDIFILTRRDTAAATKFFERQCK